MVKHFDFKNKTKPMTEVSGRIVPEFDWVPNPTSGRTSDKIIVPSGHPISKR